MARWRAWLSDVAGGVSRARTLGLAAEMSFWVFLSLVPLAAIIGYVAARLVSSQGHAPILSLLSSAPPAVRELVTGQVDQVASWKGGKVAPVAIATFVWLGSSGIHAVFDAIEVQSQTSRPWWKKRALAIATCVGLSVGVAVVAMLSAGLDWIGALVGGAHGNGPIAEVGRPALQVVRYAAAALLAVGLVAALYRLGIPRDARHRMAVLPGAITAVALQVVLVSAYGLYIGRLGTGSAYQAGLAIIGVTLMTLWLSGVALLIGVQLNHAVGCWRASKGDAVSAAPVLPAGKAWPSSEDSSSRPTSPTPRTGRSNGRSISRSESAPQSR